MYEHIILQANNQGNHYLFAVASLNYVQMDHTKLLTQGEQVGLKLNNLIRTLKLATQGPLWNEILLATQSKIF